MRYIKDIENPHCKAQLYSFNNKFILKFEIGMLEQSYKFSELDVSTHEEIEELMDVTFFTKIMKRFETMQDDLNDLMDEIDLP